MPSLSCVLSSSTSFAKLVDVLKELVDIVTLDFSNKGLSLVTMDNAHVFLIEIVLNARTAFTKYNLQNKDPSSLSEGGGGGVISVSMKTDLLHKVFKTIKPYDSVCLEMKDSADFHVTIIRAPSGSGKFAKTSRESTYRIPQVDVIDNERVYVPERNFPCEVLLPTSLMIGVCAEFKDVAVGDAIQVSISPNALVFETEDELMGGKVKITESDAQGGGIGILCSEPYSLVFKHKFFVKIGRVAKLSEATECLLQIGPEQPLALLFQLENMGSIQLFLAPLLVDPDERLQNPTQEKTDSDSEGDNEME